MANGNFFDHLDRDGRTPGDRAELAGYSGGLIGENIAAGQDGVDKVVDGWLASPGHCANLMNPGYRELGAAYATDPKSDAGIYWTGHVRFALKSSAPGADEGLGAFRKRKTRRHGAGFLQPVRPQCGALRVRRMCRLTSLYSR